MADTDITRLLERMKSEAGEQRKRTYDELVTVLYGDLKRRARQQLAGERAASFQPTLLVHEAYQRFINYSMDFVNREHFLNVAATAMRRVLVDRARRVGAAKRSGQKVSGDLESVDAVGMLNETPELLMDLDRALETLRPEQIQLTELRFFAGFSLEEAAEIMGLKVETAKKRWQIIRAILFEKLSSARQ